MDENQPVTILLLGDSECGKSTFLRRLSLGPQVDPSKPMPILRDFDQPFIFNVSVYKSKPPFRLEFYDTAAPESYTLLDPDFVIMCYDVSDRASLESVKSNWRKQVFQFRRHDSIPVMLLGLKRDLRGRDDLTAEGKIWVDPQEGYAFAQGMRCDLYAECSAITGELMRETFEDIAKRAAKTTTEEGGQSAGSPCVVS